MAARALQQSWQSMRVSTAAARRLAFGCGAQSAYRQSCALVASEYRAPCATSRLCAGFATRAELAARGKAASEPFGMQVGRLFDQLAAGVADMAAVNAGFCVERDGAERLTIDGGNGRLFTLTSEPAARRVCLTTPKHANVYYVVDPAQPGTWIGAADRHFLVELLTRELIYHCKGFPSF
jgi:hypothetical protein